MSIEKELGRIATALEAIVKSSHAIIATKVVGKGEENGNGGSVAAKNERDELKAKLTELGVEFTPKTSTATLKKLLEKASAEGAKTETTTEETPKTEENTALDNAFSFDKVKGVLSDFSKKSTENAQKVKDLVKSFGPSAKLSELSAEQRRVLMEKFAALSAPESNDDFLG